MFPLVIGILDEGTIVRRLATLRSLPTVDQATLVLSWVMCSLLGDSVVKHCGHAQSHELCG